VQDVIVIGCGGIGYYLAEPLVRFIEHLHTSFAFAKDTDVYLVDPDIIETKNAARQFGPKTVGKNKAAALADLVAERVGPKHVALHPVGSAFSPRTVAGFRKWFWKEGITVLVCVDNHPTRLLVQEEASKLNEVTVITGGNDVTDGQVQIYAKHQGKEMFPRIDHVHPEMKDAPGRFPDQISCTEQIQETPQILWTNMAVALAMGCAFMAHTNEVLYDGEVNEILIDVEKYESKAVINPSLKE